MAAGRLRTRILSAALGAIAAAGFAAFGVTPAAASEGVRLVGHLDLDPTFNHGVTVYHGTAYVGSYQGDPACPSRGVKIVDVSHPAHPALLGTLGVHPGTNNEQSRVISARTRWFRGDLLVTTLENCSNGDTPQGSEGLEFWDVTHPAAPVPLGIFVGKSVVNGFSDVALFQRGSHVYAVGTSPFSEVFTGLCVGFVCDFGGAYHPDRAEGDVIVVDATDPRHPVKVSDWGAGKDGHMSFGFEGAPPPWGCQSPSALPDFCRGFGASAWAHTVTVNRSGTHAYVGYQDDGLIILDLSDVAHPKLLAQTPQNLAEEGNTHIGVATRDERITVTSTEVYAPIFAGAGTRWGSVQLFDTSDIRHPVQVATFDTAHSKTDQLPPGCDASTFGATTYCGFTPHQHLISGRTAYFSWYNDGLRVVDISNPRSPREVGHYAPAGVDYIWIAKAGNLIFAADVNRGLDILAVPDEWGGGESD